MAIYAIGDVQGCHAELQHLLERLPLTAADELWFVGDLINRGPGSLETLRAVRAMGSRARVVLGNHDLHFLAIYFGGHKAKSSDTFDALLAAPDVDELAHWLRRQPLLYQDAASGWAMVHAGIPPFWSVAEAAERAEEVARVLRGDGFADFLRVLYGNEPNLWRQNLTGHDRVRLITNYFTRMRLVGPQAVLDFAHKEGLENAPQGLQPWFDLYAPAWPDARVVFGHWASIEGVTGHDKIVATDTGCVWGRTLTAVCLDSGDRYSVPAV